MKNLLVLFLVMSVAVSVQAQGFAFGVKGGLTLGFQKWNGSERSFLPKYNGSIYMESLPAEKRFSVFGQLGYHVKGSRLKFRSSYNPYTQTVTGKSNLDVEFNNISLVLGGKSAYSITSNGLKAYYLFGIRGDYNLHKEAVHKYDDREDKNVDYLLPFIDDDINKFTYGFTFGGGLEVPVSKFIGMTLEFQINPDLRPQVYFPAGIRLYPKPYQGAPDVYRPETKVINTTIEITVGFRFQRVVEYVED